MRPKNGDWTRKWRNCSSLQSIADKEFANRDQAREVPTPGDPSVVESTTHLGCLLEPASNGVPGNPLDPGDPGNADTLDSESDDRVESSSSMLETVVRLKFPGRKDKNLNRFK